MCYFHNSAGDSRATVRPFLRQSGVDQRRRRRTIRGCRRQWQCRCRQWRGACHKVSTVSIWCHSNWKSVLVMDTGQQVPYLTRSQVTQQQKTATNTSTEKGKVDHTPLRDRRPGCSSPSSRPWARRWRTTIICDAWPAWRQTYGYLPSCKASPPIDCYQIILLGDRGTCVNNLPSVALESGEAKIRACDLLIASPAS